MQCRSSSGVTAEMPVQLSVCTSDISTEGSGRQFEDFHVFILAGIAGLLSSGALGVC